MIRRAPPLKFRKRVARIGPGLQSSPPPPPPPPPPVALTLVAASYDTDTSVTLVFDRAIDISALDASQLQIDDQPGTGFRYLGTGAGVMAGPVTVVVALVNDGGAEDGPTRLNASATTGIVADDDGGTWAGASSINLPFP